MVDEEKTLSESRWRTGRISLRIHEDLKRALEFLAADQRRSLSQFIELTLLDHVNAVLKNKFDKDGALQTPGETLEMRPRSR
jgi:hypothetical protein